MLKAEIDIVQTQDLSSQNYMALNTVPPNKCDFKPPQPIQGSNGTTNLDSQLGTFTANTNCSEPYKGCIVQGLQGDVADGFNKATNDTTGGGIWAMTLEHDAIRMWRFFRKDIPEGFAEGGVLDVGGWGKPCPNFQYVYEDDNCDIFGIFRNQALVSLLFPGFHHRRSYRFSRFYHRSFQSSSVPN